MPNVFGERKPDAGLDPSWLRVGEELARARRWSNAIGACGMVLLTLFVIRAVLRWRVAVVTGVAIQSVWTLGVTAAQMAICLVPSLLLFVFAIRIRCFRSSGRANDLVAVCRTLRLFWMVVAIGIVLWTFALVSFVVIALFGGVGVATYMFGSSNAACSGSLNHSDPSP